MGLLQSLRGPSAISAPGALSDYWYGPLDAPSATGMPVNAETAMKTSAVYACVRLISESVGSLPIVTYRRLADGKERAIEHPLYSLLHDAPCDGPRMTAFQWKSTSQAHLLLRGNAYSYIHPGPRGAVDQLELIANPDLVTPEVVDQKILRYKIRQADGRDRIYNAEDIFHQTGLSLDGIVGVSVIKYARETIGLTLAAESYAARVFSQDGTPRGVLEHPARLSQDAIDNLRETWASRHAGLQNAHKPAVLEEGMKWHAIGVTAEDAQLLNSREFQVVDIARWFNVPLHLIQETQRSTSWGSGIEQLTLGYLAFSLLPWLRRWEDTIQQQLVLAPQRYFCEFLVDALLRGSLKDRYAAYATGRQWGWLSVNDILRLENMNPVGPAGDVRLQPLNMVPLGTPPAPPKPPGVTQPRNGNGAVHVELLKELVHGDD